jgi:hypothetical protein
MVSDDPIIKRGDLPKILSVHTDTVRVWIKTKKLPAYDVKLSSKTCGWKASTLRAAGLNVGSTTNDRAGTGPTGAQS